MADPIHDTAAEAAVLAAMMYENNLIWDAIPRLKPEDFYVQKHRVLYEAMVDICENGTGKIDIVSLRHTLESRKELKTIGGALALSEMFDILPDVSNFDTYVEIVKDHSMSRAAVGVARKLEGGAATPKDALREAMREITELVAGGGGNPLIRYEDELRKTTELWDGGGQRAAIDTGIYRLDDKVVIMKGHIVVIAGNPGTGKTAFATQVAYRTSKSHNVLFASLEMSPANVTHRIIQSKTGMSVPIIMNPKYTTEQNQAVLKDVVDREITENRNSLFMMRPGLVTPQDVLAASRAIQVKYGSLGLVVVDYLQLMHCPERGMTSQERVTWLSRNMKAVALQLDVPVLLLSQLNRGQVRDGREPELYDLRDSGAIEQDADIVIFTHRPSQETNEAWFLVKKQRYGPVCRSHAIFDEGRTRFVEQSTT